MAKRGPAPQGEYSGKSQVLSTRIRPDTRKHLEGAAKQSGRSLSQEIEHRLRKTFIEDEKIASTFGSRRNFRLMQVIAITVGELYRIDGDERDWLDDPILFDQAMMAVTALLDSIRPKGDRTVSDDPLKRILASPEIGLFRIANTFDAIQKADPSLSLDQGSRSQHLAGLMKVDLGEVANRPQVFRGTAKDFRRMADEMERADAASRRPAKKKEKRK